MKNNQKRLSQTAVHITNNCNQQKASVTKNTACFAENVCVKPRRATGCPLGARHQRAPAVRRPSVFFFKFWCSVPVRTCSDASAATAAAPWFILAAPSGPLVTSWWRRLLKFKSHFYLIRFFLLVNEMPMRELIWWFMGSYVDLRDRWTWFKEYVPNTGFTTQKSTVPSLVDTHYDEKDSYKISFRSLSLCVYDRLGS